MHIEKKQHKIAYKSKYNRKRKNQVALLMITDNDQENTEEKWHYIALKSILTDDGLIRPTRSVSALFRKVTSNHNDDVYFFGCLQPHRTDSALKNHERLYTKQDYCKPVMPSEDKKILRYNPGDESLK